MTGLSRRLTRFAHAGRRLPTGTVTVREVRGDPPRREQRERCQVAQRGLGSGLPRDLRAIGRISIVPPASADDSNRQRMAGGAFFGEEPIKPRRCPFVNVSVRRLGLTHANQHGGAAKTAIIKAGIETDFRQVLPATLAAPTRSERHCGDHRQSHFFRGRALRVGLPLSSLIGPACHSCGRRSSRVAQHRGNVSIGSAHRIANLHAVDAPKPIRN